LAAASGLVIALAAVPLAPIHAQGQISELSQDSKLIFQMASSNIMEVRLGQMAQQKASNASVKQFGQRMVTDHTSLENQLTSLVSKNGTFQPKLAKEAEAEVSRLEKLSGTEFDNQYMTSMIQHHQQDVSALQSAGQTARSAEARQMIASALPVLQQHLTLATQVGGQVGATGGVAVATQPTTQNPPTSGTSPYQAPAANTQPGQADISADLPFLREAASSNLMEVRLGQLAQTKASNQAVKQFGQRMTVDHTNLENQVTSAASAGGQTFSPTMESHHAHQVSRLEALSGEQFDRAYMSLMIKGHQRDVNNFQSQGQAAHSNQVRTLATNSLPVLQQHLSLAVQVGSQVGADTTTNYAGGNGGNQGGNGNANIRADAAFIQNVGADNTMHIQLARIALEKAKNKDVRQFAQRMVTDHSRLQDQWSAMVARNGLSFGLGMGPKHREKVEDLKKVNGKNFDKAYMTMMIQQHQQVNYWQNEGRNSKSAEVRRLVDQGLPIEEQHLAQAKQIAREVGVDPAEAVRVAHEKNMNNDKND